MDRRSHHARIHSLSTPSHPRPSTDTSTFDPSHRTNESNRAGSIRRGYSDNVGGSPARWASTPDTGIESETWMDFLRNDDSRPASHHNDTQALHPGVFHTRPRNPSGTHNHGQQSQIEGSEARKRRLTAPDSPSRRGAPPSGGGRSLVSRPPQYQQMPPGSASRYESTQFQGSPVIDLTNDSARGTSIGSQLSSGTAALGSVPGLFDRRGSDVVLPPWQPDSEVNKCPVCGNHFGFFYRKHHCRKCGRVVCANCSPHRITIPRQFIVQPPSPTAGGSLTILDPADNSEGEDNETANSEYNPALGGGEEVRVCNPCVPDPNMSPPPQRRPSYTPNTQPVDTTAFPDFWPGGQMGHGSLQTRQGGRPSFLHMDQAPLPRTPSRPQYRSSHTGMGAPGTYDQHNRRASYMSGLGAANIQGDAQRPRQPDEEFLRMLRNGASQSTADLLPGSLPQIPQATNAYPGNRGPYRYPHGHQTAQGFPGLQGRHVSHGSHGMGYPNAYYHPSGAMLPGSRPLPTSQTTSRDPQQMPRAPPPIPQRPQIAEEDECPVCHMELPPKGVDGDETAREAHIMDCIASNFVPNSSSTSNRASNPPPPPTARGSSLSISAASPSQASGSLPRNFESNPFAIAGSPVPGESGPSRPRRATGNRMLLYRATEKDCVGEDDDAQECVICFEEFEEGDEMARLECLCKFHKTCIRKWWDTKGHGSCPTHQLHD